MQSQFQNHLYDLAEKAMSDSCNAGELQLIFNSTPVDELITIAGHLRDNSSGNVISYSRKVFIPLTRLCRDICHYCTFAQSPKQTTSAYLSLHEVSALAQKGQEQGCKEALFTLGEKPELRYKEARDALQALGHDSTIEYLIEAAAMVYTSTGLLPHINCGCLDEEELISLRTVSASMGIMLESVSARLCEPGGPHYGSPDKHPAKRLATIELAGEHKVPLTTGILVGIGETRLERLESLLTLKRLHNRYGHIQEVIIQNFCPKPGTRMHAAPQPDLSDFLWTIAVARIIFGSDMNIQAPPNLNPQGIQQLMQAGINDWGGISPVTPDFVNPEAPWPNIDNLQNEMQLEGKSLVERLTIYPEYVSNFQEWLDPDMVKGTLKLADSFGYARSDAWFVGANTLPPDTKPDIRCNSNITIIDSNFRQIVNHFEKGKTLTEAMIIKLFSARDEEFDYVCNWADELRMDSAGDAVTYVINRNINYTNSCTYHCKFCAFTKGRKYDGFRDRPYLLSINEIVNRAIEAWQLSATEVCLQGGIHPSYTGHTYLDICGAIHKEIPGMHIHAFSPLEVLHGATSLNLSISEFLQQLKTAGLKSLPGTAAEILDEEIRKQLCPDKISTQQWLGVISTAHKQGLKTTATIMFGHIEHPRHWARHILHIRHLQQITGGFTEFVPLPFVHMEAPIYVQQGARKGPTFNEAVLMHAVSRIVLFPLITNIQTSWVKMGLIGAMRCLQAGANDIGGTLMNESISRAAGASHGQELNVEELKRLLHELDRELVQRDTFYRPVENQQSRIYIEQAQAI
ncbi:MAG: 5-amino-6-(D-ribitylamino)uracil--L-tyrosine 4-hydroxyphenyl transferase CofH [Proteobacteria bacterium]|nr:5-amino-6-(D-ribitylamino)uracil--L-tyrosine 4-hydroxyphenyl transferase CofH [Pseudomonadota bacterium]